MKKAICLRTLINVNGCEKYWYQVQEESDFEASFIMLFLIEEASGDVDSLTKIFSWVKEGKKVSTNAFLLYGKKDWIVIGDLYSYENDPYEILFKKTDLLIVMRQWIQFLQEKKEKIILELSFNNKIFIYGEDL